MSPDCTANCAVSWMAVTGKCRAINLCGKPTLSHGQGLTAMRSRRRKPRTSAEPTPVKIPWSARHRKTAPSFKLVVRSSWSFEVRFNPTPHPNIQQIIPQKKTSRTTKSFMLSNQPLFVLDRWHVRSTSRVDVELQRVEVCQPVPSILYTPLTLN